MAQNGWSRDSRIVPSVFTRCSLFRSRISCLDNTFIANKGFGSVAAVPAAVPVVLDDVLDAAVPSAAVLVPAVPLPPRSATKCTDPTSPWPRRFTGVKSSGVRRSGRPFRACVSTVLLSARQFGSEAWCGFGLATTPTIFFQGRSSSARSAIAPLTCAAVFLLYCFMPASKLESGRSGSPSSNRPSTESTDCLLVRV